MKQFLMPRLLVLFCFLGLQLLCKAQISVMRNFFPAPLADTSYSKAFFGKLDFSAEGSRGFGSALGEQAWNVKYVGFVELYRFSPRLAIAGALAHEFTANPHNDINFHMRGAIWNESISLFYKLKSATLELGVTHHCRHEIDNSVPANELKDNIAFVPSRRLIVLTAPFVSLQSRWFHSKRFSSRAYARANFYTYHVDGRKPRGNYEQSLDHIRASLIFGGRVNYLLKGISSMYVRAWYNPAYFTEGVGIRQNYRMEMGISLGGKAGNFELFGGYEYFFDDMSRPYPLLSQVLSIGVRGSTSGLF